MKKHSAVARHLVDGHRRIVGSGGLGQSRGDGSLTVGASRSPIPATVTSLGAGVQAVFSYPGDVSAANCAVEEQTKGTLPEGEGDGLLPDLLHRRDGAVRRIRVDRDDLGAAAGEFAGDGVTETSRGTGDDSHPASVG